MSFYFKEIRHYKRGAKWDDGSPRMCTRCGAEKRRKRKQARYVALLMFKGSDNVMPVSYCSEHVPEEVKQG